ncbi:MULTISPECIES: ImmA/IrrE family metallo-endopeptidase [Burkholderia]|uniref:ImmA/IrrE family metallo-endopeptidase n=1 Tax=Burkholderia TaxID=32008 RepID=UPI001592E063|nr:MULTISPECIES: ImmA/IrrE family metallo-endopeptidase [Burkholderia]MDA0573253.1 ImmA/IrrE family metallo-endopeptidase [Burkholderia gladioli]MDA0601427.1 ImmA/IrrE family metallo-endopeptidase [Burkholderia gladioli]NVE22832.1 ImmA/IrrE family metallo-endopeptidase [Burkholderia glumae]
MQVQGYETPTPLNLGPKQVAALAEHVSKQVNYKAGDDLKELVTRMGGRVAYVDFWGGAGSSSGSIEIKDKTFEIRLALDTGMMRDRFTIAHELGHYVLHYLYPNQKQGKNITWLVAERNGSGQVEKEANWFAAAFLMPEAEYRDMHAKHGGDHFMLSSYFQVSVQASTVRAKVLGLE